MRVLGIQLASLNDLIRLAISIKRERQSIIAFPVNNRFVAGVYLPSFTKEISAVFPHVTLDFRPNSIYWYTSNDNGTESISDKMVKSTSYVPIMIAFLRDIPHEYIDLHELKCELTLKEIENLDSLVYLSLSLLDTWLYIPFVWYDIDKKTFVLTLEIGYREEYEGGLLILVLPYNNLDADDLFILYDQENNETKFSNGFCGVNYQYISIIKTRMMPFLK